MHEFHVWSLSENEKVVLVHLETTGADDAMVYNSAFELCNNYGVHFFTIQLETKRNLCPLSARN